jgi:hypothetical protein
MTTDDILSLADNLERSSPEDAAAQREFFERVRALRTTSEVLAEPECARRLEAAGMLIGYLSQMGSVAGHDVQGVAVRLLRSVVEKLTADDLRRAAQNFVAVGGPRSTAPSAPLPQATSHTTNPLPGTTTSDDRSATDVIEDGLLGQILLQRGQILEEHIQAAMRIQRASGTRIGDILVKTGACSRQQLADALQYQTSLRRARGSLTAAPGDPVRIKPKETRGLGLKLMGEALLGEILIERGVITRRHLERALEVQKVTGMRIGEALVEMGAATSEAIEQALRAQGGGRSFTRGGHR